jgi:hypothetical protein
VTQLGWSSVDVDGETYFWTTYRSKRKVNGGPWEPIESLRVIVCATMPAIGTTHPGGTVVTEQHAADLVRFFKAHGREAP